jgi:hypothetical protein
MTDQEKTEQWQHCIDRVISRAVLIEKKAPSVESVIDRAGLVECEETRCYASHMLAAIHPPSWPIRRDDPIPVEERCECLVKVLFADADQFDDEAKVRALDGQRTLRVIRALYERMQLRTLLAEETDAFLREHGVEDNRTDST